MIKKEYNFVRLLRLEPPILDRREQPHISCHDVAPILSANTLDGGWQGGVIMAGGFTDDQNHTWTEDA